MRWIFADQGSPLIHLFQSCISSLGPVDVESSHFQKSAQALLGKPVDEILATVDALVTNGIVTPRLKPVRVIPDVLSDYLLEERCINKNGQSTLYADRVYEHFGAHSLKNLMRNLSKLDWRRGQSGQSGQFQNIVSRQNN